MSDQNDNLTQPFDGARDATYQPNPAEPNAAGTRNVDSGVGGQTTGSPITVNPALAAQRFAAYSAANPDVGLPTVRGVATLTSAGMLLFDGDDGADVSVWQRA